MEFKFYLRCYLFILFAFIALSKVSAQETKNELKNCLQFFLDAHQLASEQNLELAKYQKELKLQCSAFSKQSHNFSTFKNEIEKYISSNLVLRVQYDLYQYALQNKKVLAGAYKQVEYYPVTSSNVFEHGHDYGPVTYTEHQVPVLYPELTLTVTKVRNILGIKSIELHNEVNFEKSTLILKLKELQQKEKWQYLVGCSDYLLNTWSLVKKDKENFDEKVYLDGVNRLCSKVLIGVKKLPDAKKLNSELLTKMQVDYFLQKPEKRILFDISSFLMQNQSFISGLSQENSPAVIPELKKFKSVLAKLYTALELTDEYIKAIDNNFNNVNVRKIVNNLEQIQAMKFRVNNLGHYAKHDPLIVGFLAKCLNEPEKPSQLINEYQEIKYAQSLAPSVKSDELFLRTITKKVEKIISGEKTYEQIYDVESAIERLSKKIYNECFDTDFIHKALAQINLYLRPYWQKVLQQKKSKLENEVKSGLWNKTTWDEYYQYQQKLGSSAADLEREKSFYHQQSLMNLANTYKDYISFTLKYHLPEERHIKEYQRLHKLVYGHEDESFDYKIENASKVKAILRKRSCTAINNTKNSVLGPASDQGSTHWCGHFAASDLLSHKYKKRFSVTDIANTYFESIAGNMQHSLGFSEAEFLNDIPAYGSILLNSVRKRGVCLEKDAPKPNQVQRAISDAETLVAEIARCGEGFEIEKYASSPPPEWAQAFPHLTQYEYLRTAIRSRIDNVYDNLMEKNCQGRRVFLDFEIHKRLYYSSDEFFEERDSLDQVLESGGIILAAVHTGQLFNPIASARKLHPTHYLNIVGREFNSKNGTCEYILRNSWGEGCTSYSGHRCDKGHIWVPEANLARNIYETIYLE